MKIRILVFLTACFSIFASVKDGASPYFLLMNQDSEMVDLASFIGKKVIIPLTKRCIHIIADEYADPSKGSGAVKITPAHDFNDFLVAKKHNLNFINIFDKQAKLNSSVPNKLIGMDRYDARKSIIEALRQNGQLTKIENNKMFVPTGDRTGEVIEP